MPRVDRMRDLMEILRSGRASSQFDIVTELRQRGHEVTQATVSRDLREIGAVKLRIEGDHVYQLPDEATGRSLDVSARNLQRSLDEFALSIDPSGTMLVVRTPPGHAPLLARSIDLSNDPAVVGTVAGDDTIFVAFADETAAALARDRWLDTRTDVAVRSGEEVD